MTNQGQVMSLPELFERFPDDATAEEWFAEARWGGKPACPHCGSFDVQQGAKHPTMPYRCREKECRKRFSAKTNTAMQASNIGFRKWLIAIYLVTTRPKGVSSVQLAKDIAVTQSTARHMLHRIREAWRGNPLQQTIECRRYI